MLEAYSYEIECKPTQQHVNADSLSRLPLKVTDNPMDEVNVFNIAQVEALPITAEQFTTSTKTLLSQVYYFIQSGYPTEVDDVLLSYPSIVRMKTIAHSYVWWE